MPKIIEHTLADLNHLRPDQRWNHLLFEEYRIRELIAWQRHNGPLLEAHETRDWKTTVGIDPTREQLQSWWRAVENIWREYARQIAAGLNPTPPPADLAYVMAELCGLLGVGKMPEPIRDAISEGRTEVGPRERRDIGIAIAYHKAAKGGIIHNGQTITVSDASPTKTISEHFNVKANTVRSWVRKYQPAFLGVNGIDEALLLSMMKTAGKNYSTKGRSFSAIAKRPKGSTVNPLRN